MNFGEVVHLVPTSNSSNPSRSSSRSSSSYFSETSSSKGSDYIFGDCDFGDDIYGDDFGAFPSTGSQQLHHSNHVTFPNVDPIPRKSLKKKPVVVLSSRQKENRHETMPVLQKSAMSAFISSPSQSRWSDLVRTMRVESRINSWGFTSLHDDIDKMVDDCYMRNEQREKFCVASEIKDDKCGMIDLTKTFSKETEATHNSTSSSSSSDSPSSGWSSGEESKSNYFDDSFSFATNFPDHQTIQDEQELAPNSTNQQAQVSFPVKLAMIEFMKHPQSPSAWAELVDSFRQDKMNETEASDKHGAFQGEETSTTEPTVTPGSSWDDGSESGWANFDDVSIKNNQDVIVEHDFKFQQKCAMDAFLQKPCKDRWTELVQSIREEKMRQPELTCPTLLRLESRLEKLEEEASGAESESGEGSKVIEVDCYGDEIHYAV